ncbi:MAG: bifunctional phosphoribosyl-AMP cyclohydrolase/phosphoribosyl-ATP diphosphatase HisIE [Candidatus Carbobacillus sp.]|nr:bifunctional phosphoribosyl-AMP cyclohydrolase/phosphoribosyl-ATP diphosphatase HisIE [Candidatus Carbobacillus sp.]
MRDDAAIKDWMRHMRWDDQGLIPVIIVHHSTNEVLTLAYMNQEAFLRTVEHGEVWLYSRSRQSLWHKGETSGNIQKVMGMRLDCDGDALIVDVEPHGPACHTGAWTCFHRMLPTHLFQKQPSLAQPTASPSDSAPSDDADERMAHKHDDVFYDVLRRLYDRIEERRRQLPAGSYTTYLFQEGTDKILKKLGEEAVEVIIAAAKHPPDDTALIEEMADLLYHLLVLMVAKGLSLEALADVLSSRLLMQRDQKYSRRPVDLLQPPHDART